MSGDTYKTISEKKTGEGIYTEKRSKFLAFAHHVETADEVKAVVARYRKDYFDARHVCWAYMLGEERDDFRANDDGEPSGTAGKPILGQINSQGLTNVLVVVIRYFGGVKLGTGGLIAAYKQAAAAAIDDAQAEERLIEERVAYTFTYVMMNDVMRVVKALQPRIVSQTFDNTCEIVLAIRRSQAANLRKRLEQLSF